ncbi:TPA: UDP-galactopyranose mutase [Citrobacter farmeri]|uniref:UDP-galactopyranose mutase n=1 Tax=Citrobacter farmeri TaxID=67824 RepID=UPI00189EEA0E|nr:UDP-galactopyranose mutase [Citrobacter farmeri]EHK0944420.1 UDP-galactopyranose mutase [Citrobacter farmeri]EKX4539777.1 UDP-galactopyranose mutase [Citrobacter farmeri]MDB2162799.1 UDP-galactopyranose mutase [Citrobacter farmeri]HBC0357715.1 UDP-galactopyranose mutase [Citrobacter farmeri]HBZ8835893.1 UDP-galactopyranose mutase [Citrobacter farmeri]
MNIDYLIVGSGLFGAVFAHEANKRGKKVRIIEKREHVGGNVYCDKLEGINVHKYGAHIFHTNDKGIWDYVNQFVEFNRFTNSPMAISGGKIYNLPFNMNTFSQLWGIVRPEEAKDIIKKQSAEFTNKEPSNLEEQAISLVGRDVFEYFIKEYTEKQWGRECKDLPAFIIKRLPVRFTYDNNYFKDKYQGIPVGGYNELINGLLDGIDVHLNTDYFSNKEYYDNLADKVIYTGPIDRFFDYCFGRLDYRSLRFEHEIHDTDNFQGNAVINYIDKKYNFTRIIEHKHFEFGTQEKTVITKEYPKEFEDGDEYYYPVNDSKNNKLFSQYRQLSLALDKFIFGGRLAEYKYYDMHQVIASALRLVSDEFS